MKTLKNFKEYCGENLAALVSPVKNQLGVNLPEFWAEMENVSKSYCGAAAGFGGFIYYSETVKFWRTYRPKIYAYMDQLADELGENVLQMVCGFNSLQGYETEEIARALYGNYNSDYDVIYNTFAWFALEEVANAYSNYSYENR